MSGHLCEGIDRCNHCGAEAPPPWPRIALEVDAVLRDLCHHCGKRDEADGCHSCPCPNTDAECPVHA